MKTYVISNPSITKVIHTTELINPVAIKNLNCGDEKSFEILILILQLVTDCFQSRLQIRNELSPCVLKLQIN